MAKATLDARLEGRNEASDYRRIELITGRRRRRDWSDDEKARIVGESTEPGANISSVARRHDLSRGLLTVWRRAAGVAAGDDRRRRAVPEAAVFIPIEIGRDDGVAGGGRGAGTAKIEVNLAGGRIVIDAAIDPRLAAAVIAAVGTQR